MVSPSSKSRSPAEIEVELEEVERVGHLTWGASEPDGFSSTFPSSNRNPGRIPTTRHEARQDQRRLHLNAMGNNGSFMEKVYVYLPVLMCHSRMDYSNKSTMWNIRTTYFFEQVKVLLPDIKFTHFR